MARGAYYGHPNRNRAREDSRQCFYYLRAQAGSAACMPLLASFAEASYEGIKEVLSNIFPAMKHDLLVRRFSTGNRGSNGLIKRLQLTGGPTASVVVTDLIAATGLDIGTTPSGAYYVPRPQKGELFVLEPDYPTPPAGGVPVPIAV